MVNLLIKRIDASVGFAVFVFPLSMFCHPVILFLNSQSKTEVVNLNLEVFARGGSP